MAKTDDLKVFISSRESTCDECGEELGRKAWITLRRDKGALCLACADLDHLAFLPTGDATLTRRSKRYSSLWAVVLKFSKARRRYERQGLLVEEAAIDRAEEECLADAEARARRRERDEARRALLDEAFVATFTAAIRDRFPGCPEGREAQIAAHACLKYSGRVGRSAAAKALDDTAVILAVEAHVRHQETDYDDLLMQGRDRHEARQEVRRAVDEVLRAWSAKV